MTQTEQQKQPTTATSPKPEPLKAFGSEQKKEGDGKAPSEEKLQSPDQAPKPERKYRTLKAGEYIARCTYILPNQCQCWKHGEEEVTESTTDAEGKKAELKYQLCERHAKIRRAIDLGVMKTEMVNTMTKEWAMGTPEVPLSDPTEPETPEVVNETDVPEKTEKEKDVASREKTGAFGTTEAQPAKKEGESSAPTKTPSESGKDAGQGKTEGRSSTY